MRHKIFNRNRNYVVITNITVSQARKKFKHLPGVSDIVADKKDVRIYITTTGGKSPFYKVLENTSAYIKGRHNPEPDHKKRRRDVKYYDFPSRKPCFLISGPYPWSTKIPKITIQSMCEDLAKSNCFRFQDEVITSPKRIMKICQNNPQIVTHYWYMLPDNMVTAK